jgi:hypothetical protein
MGDLLIRLRANPNRQWGDKFLQSARRPEGRSIGRLRQPLSQGDRSRESPRLTLRQPTAVDAATAHWRFISRYTVGYQNFYIFQRLNKYHKIVNVNLLRKFIT